MRVLTIEERERIVKAQIANRKGEEKGETVIERLQRSIEDMKINRPIEIQIEDIGN